MSWKMEVTARKRRKLNRIGAFIVGLFLVLMSSVPSLAAQGVEPAR